jgi:hypothetical protein
MGLILIGLSSTALRAQVSDTSDRVAAGDSVSVTSPVRDTANGESESSTPRLEIAAPHGSVTPAVADTATDTSRAIPAALTGVMREHYVTLIEAVEASYREDYARAESLLTEVSTAAPEHPVGPLMLAATVQAHMLDREVLDRADEFLALIDTAEARARSWITDHPDDPWGYTLLGHGYGYRAMWEGKYGSWFKAMKLGRKAKGAYHDAIKADSACWDLYVGLGNYHYWKSARTEFINWTGLIKDEKDRGIRELGWAIERSYFSSAAAAAALIWVNLHRGEYDQAISLARTWGARYPESKTYIWGRAYAEFLAGYNDSALVRFDSLRALTVSDPEQGLFNLIEIDWHRAHLLKRLGNHAGACAVMDSVLAYPADEDVRKRQKDRLKDAGKFVKKRCD